MNLQFKRQLDYLAGYFLIGINLVAARLLGLIMRRNHSLDPPPAHIFVIKMLGLGSVLIAADSMAALRKKYPSATLILICGKGVKPGIEPLGMFDEIFEIRDDSFLVLLKSSIHTLWKCWRRPNRWVMDLEVYSRLTTIYSLWTCARNRFGFHLNPVRFRRSINTHNVYFNQFVHVEKNYEALVMAMGAEKPVPTKFPAFPFKARSGAEKYLAINNTCSDLSRERKMSEQLFKQLIHHLLSETSYALAFTGAPSDASGVQKIIDEHFADYKHRLRVIAGALSFQEYYHFLYQECRAMITIDSAPLHIANRLMIPVLSLWGPTNPENLSKESELHRSIYLRKNCSPCVHHTEVLPCGGDNTCMKEITWPMIKFQLDKLLQSSIPAQA
ncbi:MAG: glycosyltransferase family 9 protein [Cytophagaceae bacterium]|jgi:ADP-heptose:LPS heptosyltransferase|nr:glycosyltransferase family 9 protein [Cytophagaceae bacterium]